MDSDGAEALQQDRRVVWHLKRAPVLSALPAADLSGLAAESEVEEFRRRRVIYMPGDPGDAVFLVSAGQVKASRVTPDGKALTLAYRGAGEIFGELCIIDGGPREEMVEVVENATVVRMPRGRFEQLASENVQMSWPMARTLAETRRALERKVEDLVFKDVNAKLAELLLKLSESEAASESKGAAPPIRMTHQEMANLIGSTRETVSLTLSQFKRKKLIHTHARKVTVTDPEGLRALI